MDSTLVTTSLTCLSFLVDRYARAYHLIAQPNVNHHHLKLERLEKDVDTRMALRHNAFLTSDSLTPLDANIEIILYSVKKKSAGESVTGEDFLPIKTVHSVVTEDNYEKFGQSKAYVTHKSKYKAVPVMKKDVSSLMEILLIDAKSLPNEWKDLNDDDSPSLACITPIFEKLRGVFLTDPSTLRDWVKNETSLEVEFEDNAPFCDDVRRLRKAIQKKTHVRIAVVEGIHRLGSVVFYYEGYEVTNVLVSQSATDVQPPLPRNSGLFIDVPLKIYHQGNRLFDEKLAEDLRFFSKLAATKSYKAVGRSWGDEIHSCMVQYEEMLLEPEKTHRLTPLTGQNYVQQIHDPRPKQRGKGDACYSHRLVCYQGYFRHLVNNEPGINIYNEYHGLSATDTEKRNNAISTNIMQLAKEAHGCNLIWKDNSYAGHKRAQSARTIQVKIPSEFQIAITLMTCGVFNHESAKTMKNFCGYTGFKFTQNSTDIDVTHIKWIETNILNISTAITNKVMTYVIKKKGHYKRFSRKVEWLIQANIIQDILQVITQYGPDPVMNHRDKQIELINATSPDINGAVKFRGSMAAILQTIPDYYDSILINYNPEGHNMFPPPRDTKSGIINAEVEDFMLPDEKRVSTIIHQIVTGELQYEPRELIRANLFREKKKNEDSDDQSDESRESGGNGGGGNGGGGSKPPKSKKEKILQMIRSAAKQLHGPHINKCLDTLHTLDKFIESIEIVEDRRTAILPIAPEAAEHGIPDVSSPSPRKTKKRKEGEPLESQTAKKKKQDDLQLDESSESG